MHTDAPLTFFFFAQSLKLSDGAKRLTLHSTRVPKNVELTLNTRLDAQVTQHCGITRPDSFFPVTVNICGGLSIIPHLVVSDIDPLI